MPTNVSFSGGEKLQALFKNAGKGGVKSVDVGIFSGAKYPDGTPVALVATVNEFGSEDGKIPERPAIRNANKSNEDNLVKIIKNNIDPETMVIDSVTAGRVGVAHESATKKSIVDLKDPPNAPATLKAKAPRANPLVNSGTLVRSVTHKVNK